MTRLRIHVDAALAGLPLALLDDAERPAFDFAAGATSMVISGHKFLSTLTPCGVVVFDQPPAGSGRRVPYLATHDSTITGSRSGHTSVLLRQSLFKLGVDGHRQRAESARALARHLHQRLGSIGWPARRNEHGFTVVMRRPQYAVRQRWHLAYQRDEAHVVCMPGVTREQIDAFVADIAANRLP